MSEDSEKPPVTLSSNLNEPPGQGNWSTLDGRPIWSPPPGPGEPGYSQDLGRDIGYALNPTERASKLEGKFWGYIDKAVLSLFELLALLFGLPFGDALYHKTPITTLDLVYLGIGALFAVGGPMFPLTRTVTWIPRGIAPSISAAARDARIWIAVLLLFFFYGVAPGIYRRAIAPAASTTDEIATATAPIRAELDAANRQLQEEREKAKPLLPTEGVVSGRQVVNELKDLRTQIDELKRQNDALRQAKPPPAVPLSHPKQAIPELVVESGALLDIVRKTLIPLENEWRVTLGGQNPERICIDLSSSALQAQIMNLAERLHSSDRAILEILDQNGIDRKELDPLVGHSPILGPQETQINSAVLGLGNYRDAIKKLGEHPTCEEIIKADTSRQYRDMTNTLNVFNDWVSQSQQRVSSYRDALRKEARDAP